MEPTQALLLANIKRIRKEKGLTQKDVAEGCGMLVPTYSRLERGGSNPSLASIVRIADALGIGVIELFQSSEIKDKSVAQKLSMINELSEYNRNVVTILLDSMIEKDRVEKLQDVKMKSRLSELNAIRKKA
ncbi:helix-turn-helix domain-containing protein [Polaribacter cellanae]|uniref:Helix-turn-helix transcriptional regulator n=1 Tax=Polaribacter cellanae TaxID=2818493 RepID=A0A975CM96_9FLAO|nr:helix-turn-helix transcriptional regulator [Polaribacter cellanae]QTE21125.1 helix-turn-helix transcriptional regulator [Polaribacter cellanae]